MECNDCSLCTGLLTVSGVSIYISYSQQALEELQLTVDMESLAHVHMSFGWSLVMACLSFCLELLTGILLILAARLIHRQCHHEPAAVFSMSQSSPQMLRLQWWWWCCLYSHAFHPQFDQEMSLCCVKVEMKSAGWQMRQLHQLLKERLTRGLQNLSASLDCFCAITFSSRLLETRFPLLTNVMCHALMVYNMMNQAIEAFTCSISRHIFTE